MTTDSKELLACPFCGGEADYYLSNEAVFSVSWVAHVVHCKTCQARVQTTAGMETAIDMWNTRHTASPADPKPAPDAMRDALDPFAKAAEMYNDIPGVVRTHGNVELWQQPNNIRGTRLTVGHLRAARAALSAPAPVPPPDVAHETKVTRESIAQELVLYERWTILDETTRAMIHRAISFILNIPTATRAPPRQTMCGARSIQSTTKPLHHD